MPFKSKAQMRKFFLMEQNGEIPKGTTEKWAKETRRSKDLPEHVANSKSKNALAKAAAIMRRLKKKRK